MRITPACSPREASTLLELELALELNAPPALEDWASSSMKLLVVSGWISSSLLAPMAWTVAVPCPAIAAFSLVARDASVSVALIVT